MQQPSTEALTQSPGQRNSQLAEHRRIVREVRLLRVMCLQQSLPVRIVMQHGWRSRDPGAQ